MKTRKPLRSIFLRAAELVDNARSDSNNNHHYACSALLGAIIDDNPQTTDSALDTPEFRMFKFYFKQSAFAWWEKLDNGDWDYESRIFALLLCAEMVRR